MTEHADANANPSLETIAAQASSELHITPSIYLRILKSSIPQTQDDIRTITDAIAANDYVNIQSASHRLKGVYANLRLTVLSNPATEINDLAKTNGDIQKIKALFEIFCAQFTTVSAKL